MVTQEQFKQHYQNLYDKKAVYLWGANTETITKALTDRLYRAYGSATYNKTYYDNKAKNYTGRIGADCSGSIYPLSKADNTARGYYNACNKKGPIKDLPANTACLVFNSTLTHVGAYMGDGTTIEMMGDAKNCVKQNIQKSRWAYYGIPNWLDTTTKAPIATTSKFNKKEVIKNIQRWCNHYCGTRIAINGLYGPETKTALCKALQYCLNKKYKAGLVVDGVFGSKTKAKCKKASASKELAYICKAMLMFKGYDISYAIKYNNITSSYGSKIKKTVKEYQKSKRGLKVDGICGAATFYKLFNS